MGGHVIIVAYSWYTLYMFGSNELTALHQHILPLCYFNDISQALECFQLQEDLLSRLSWGEMRPIYGDRRLCTCPVPRDWGWGSTGVWDHHYRDVL